MQSDAGPVQPARLGPEHEARYSQLLLDRDRAQALALVRELLADDDVDVRSVYLDVLAPSQHRIGDLWQRGVVSVAQEHYCTAVTQQAIGLLYPHVFTTPPDGRRAVVAAVSGELHELGGRMVADFLQLAGWDTSYLSANTPLHDIAAEVEAVDAHLLACSIALPDRLPMVERTVEIVRARRPDVAVVVGGRPFTLDEDLWRAVGADGTAPDALAAVALADRLVPPPPAAGASAPRGARPARAVPTPSREVVADALEAHADQVIAHTVTAALADAAATARLGEDPEGMLAAGLRFTTDGLVSAIRYDTTAHLADQLAWAVDRLPLDGVPVTDLRTRLHLYRDAVRAVLPGPEADVVAGRVDWMVEHLDTLTGDDTTS